MNNPAEQREKIIKAAEKARLLISAAPARPAVELRATILHDRVSEGIKTICAEHSVFDIRQTEVLTEIAVHLALVFDKELQPPDTFLKRLADEVRGLGAVGRIGFVGVLVAIVLGLFQIAQATWEAGTRLWPDDSFSADVGQPSGPPASVPINPDR